MIIQIRFNNEEDADQAEEALHRVGKNFDSETEAEEFRFEADVDDPHKWWKEARKPQLDLLGITPYWVEFGVYDSYTWIDTIYPEEV